MQKCKYRNKTLAVISGWTRASIVIENLDTIMERIEQRASQNSASKWLSVFEETEGDEISGLDILIPCRVVNPILPVVPIIQMCNRIRDVHSLPPTEVEKVIKMRDVLDITSSPACCRRLLASNIRAHHVERQTKLGMNRDGVATSVCCKLDGKAFRFYLEESFNIFTKHSEDGQYLVKNYQY